MSSRLLNFRLLNPSSDPFLSRWATSVAISALGNCGHDVLNENMTRNLC